MAQSWLHRLLKTSRPLSRSGGKKTCRGRFVLSLEALDERMLPAVTASFSAATGVLTVMGDDQDNSLAVSRDAAGSLVVHSDGDFVTVQGGTPTAANTTLIQIFGLGGNDELIWSRSQNLPRALVDGGSGDDDITSGSFNDTLIGGAGNDTYRLDTDAALGSDTIDESGGGIDTLDFSSTTTRAMNINLANPAAQVVNAGLTLTLSAGNTIENVIGGDLNDTLTGNVLNNVIQGSGGNDTVVGGAGNDTFVWDPGDGNDIVDGITGDGLTGSDRLVFNGSDEAEKFDISAVGNGGRVTRDVDNVTLDLVGVETVDFNANGGADIINVGDLSATAVTAVNLDVGPSGDGEADAVVVNGSAGNDRIDVLIAPVRVIGLHAPVALANLAASDSLTINAGGGDDEVVASSILAGGFKLTENGGDGNDTLVGSRGNDTLIGGDGDDFFLGFRGSDTAFMGAGDDTFEWDQGDGSDTIEGQGGRDAMLFNAGNEAENFDLSANGNHVRFLRTVANAANVTMDLNGVEEVDLNARSGADAIVVNDLSATDLTALSIDLDGGQLNGTGDGASDSVIVNGTAGDDAIQIVAFDDGTRVAVGGLFPFVNITGSDGTNDHLTLNTLGGNDVVDAANLPPNLIGLTVNLGEGQAAATTTTLVSSAPTGVFGQTVSLTATVNSQAGVPTGTVTFLDGTTVLGTAPVNAAGQATLAVSLDVGSHALTASFVGTGDFAGSTSAVAAVTVNRAATTVALGSSVNPAVTGQAVTFTATVAAVAPGAGTPTGTVTFKDGSLVLGSVAVGAGGAATFATNFAAAGGHVIAAVYSGDVDFVASSQALTEQVNVATRKATTTSLVASANPVVVGHAVTFTSTVSDPSGTSTPTGTVTFFVGNKVVARARLDANGQARFTRVFLRARLFTIRAVYSGDATFVGRSQSLTEQVNP